MTLVAVTSVALGPTIEALRASMREVDLAHSLLLSDQQPEQLDSGIEWRPIERLASRRDYSRFMLHGLAEHISTEHVLCIQWDGYVVNGAAWDPQFLNYDYIGAVWPHFRDAHNVGNGGFSLRSRRLLEACRVVSVTRMEPEDVLIARIERPRLEQCGIRFAPAQVAHRFSYERTLPRGDEFGFHGAFNLVRHVNGRDAARIFRSLDQGMLARNERWQLLRWGIGHGKFAVASAMIGRIIRDRPRSFHGDE